MSLPEKFEVINTVNLTDLASGEPLTSVVIGVYPEEGRQYTGLNAVWLIESTERCRREEDIPDWKNTLAAALHNSAVRVFERFSRSKNPRDLDIVITLHRKVVALTDASHSDYPKRMSNLASFLEDRYKLSGDANDLDNVVDLLRTILFERTDPGFPALDTWYYGYLADSLVMRYNVSRTEDDADEVLALRRKVVELTPPFPLADYLKVLQGLAQALAEVFRVHKDRSGEMMEEAIQLQKIILVSASPNSDNTKRYEYLRDLAEFMFARFGTASEHKEDVQEMIGLYDQLVKYEQASNPGPHSGTIHSHFAAVLNERFRRTGTVDDLDRAISFQLRALELQGPKHPLRHTSLVLLGYMLRSQFIYSGGKDALDRSINCLREALKLVPHPHENRPMVLNNLSIVLRRAFEEYEEYDFLREAIEFEEEALKLPPTTKENRLASLANMAAALWARYHRTGGKEVDLNSIISLYEEALALMTDKHHSYPFICGNIGTILGVQLDKKPIMDEDGLRKSVNFIRKSLAGFDSPHEESCTMSGNLGVACFRLYDLTKNSAFIKEGVQSFRNAANHPSAATSLRFRAARIWAEKAEEVNDASTLEAYRTLIALLPELVAVNADIESRQHRLKSGVAHTDGIGLAAAAYALREGKVEDASQFLEEGRALFWNQAFKLRTPLSDLHIIRPDLAERFQAISKRLEASSFKASQDDVFDIENSNEVSALIMNHEDSVKRGHMKTEWDAVIAEIRRQPGFEGFLATGSISSTLQELALKLDGPIIVLCVTRKVSGAIIITGNNKEYLSLPRLSSADVMNMVKMMRYVSVPGRSKESDMLSESEFQAVEDLFRQYSEAEATLTEEQRSFRKRPMLRNRLSVSSILQHVLEELWNKIGEPVIQFLKLKKSEPLLRVYWCPTGPSTFLPIHAAGIYDIESSNSSDNLMDYMVSSYIPTLGTLVNILNGQGEKDKENDLHQNILTIVQPQTLPSALDELRKIEKVCGQNSQVYPNLSQKKLGDQPSNPATVKSVLDELPSSSIVHFACHGKQISGNPLNSALILEDGKLTVSRLMQVEMKRARLAFLCACETAMGERDIPDESMHIGAALLFAGFQGVVATMWSIADADGPTVAEEFYGYLMGDKNQAKEGTSVVLDTRKGARALHEAVVKLRSDGVPLQRWVPFIYLGK